METERILLRPWQDSDAETLFKYASDPDVGPRAGWPPHKSVEESLEIIRTVFSAEGMWAVIWRETGEAIGCVGYLPVSASNQKIAEDQVEVGYWIARPFWGKGICTEALQMVIDYCFNEKGFTVYYMEYKGDDGFKELMRRGGSKGINDLANYTTEFLSKGYFKTAKIDCPVMPVGCSTLTVRTPEGGAMMARNFDYPYGTAMIMHVTPDEGYESITTFSTDFYGFGEDYKPEGFKNQYMALAGLFLALDGINEKGFAIAVLDAGDKVVTNQNSSKPDLATTSATQYLLKNAANVDEALQLLRGIDMNSDPGSAYHYSMADASGRSVAVEYVDNRMVVTESPFVTNHYLCEEKFQAGLHEGDHRHEKLMEQYDKAGGVMNEKELTDAIVSVTQLPEKGAII